MTVSILGCGWFGRALAADLILKGIKVKGSATSPEKLAGLSALGISPHLIKFPDRGDHDPGFFDCDVLVVSITPKFRKGETEDFTPKIKQIISTIKQYQIQKVIYTSSTAVYGANQGMVNELTEPMPDDTSGKLLLQAEQLFQNQADFLTAIIRFGGLVGPGRHPGRFFAGKKDISNGLGPVNLVHLNDAVSIALAVVEKNAWGQVFNASAPDHPTRAAFYTRATQTIGLEAPTFKNELLDQKTVDSVKIKPVLGYQFMHDKWMDELFD
jgi:nucleoside-diphosphate-sugar epimerase